jgi:hypothetical protein
MSGTPTWGLQQAIYARLNGDNTLTSTLGAAVYDEAPDGVAFPYITIGQVTEAPNPTMGRTGRDLTVTLHIWSQAKGYKQTKDIQNRIDALLEWWKPTVTGWHSTVCQQEFFEVFRDEDGITRHGVSRYRIHLHK